MEGFLSLPQRIPRQIARPGQRQHPDPVAVRTNAAGDGPGYALRWFTPTTEVDLCGHATLAAAHALVSMQNAPLPLSFHTRSGELKVARDTVGGVLLTLDFPAAPPTEIGRAHV